MGRSLTHQIFLQTGKALEARISSLFSANSCQAQGMWAHGREEQRAPHGPAREGPEARPAGTVQPVRSKFQGREELREPLSSSRRQNTWPRDSPKCPPARAEPHTLDLIPEWRPHLLVRPLWGHGFPCKPLHCGPRAALTSQGMARSCRQRCGCPVSECQTRVGGGEEVAGTGAAVALGEPAAAPLPGLGSAACPRLALHSTLGAPSQL